jgi:hypothetical protein
MTVTAYPLHWPQHVARVKVRQQSKFRVTHSEAFEDLLAEVSRFGGSGLVVSSNAPLRKTDRTPYRDALTDLVDDPGVAVYFRRKGIDVVFACDTYRCIWENMRAISMTLDALRAIERHGAEQMLNQAFKGFTALPAPEANQVAWWQVLGVPRDASPEAIQAAWKAKVREVPEDQRGPLNIARDAGLRERGA